MSESDSQKVDLRSEIPRFKEATPPPAFGEFIENMRRLQDLAVCIDAPEEVYLAAQQKTAELAELLAPYAAREGQGPANRSMQLPGRGSLLMPPWRIEKFDAESVVARGMLRRYHLGGGGVAHGGVLPLIFDDNFGNVVFAANRPISRTAYLHVNYRKVTPLNVPLVIEGRVDRMEGRKTFITARLTEEDGTLLADGEGLMVELLPGQP
ncbi:PaaI family thioesterase [Tsukamurella serpentis]